MYLCFIVEEQYRHDSMPTVIADQLRQRGHTIDLLEPPDAVTCLSDLAIQRYDAYVLKTVAGGPGLSILEAAEAVGIPTINNSRSISLVRDKTIAAAFAHARGLPVPRTYFIARLDLLKKIPAQDYPLVVKPTNGSACRDIYRLNSPADLVTLETGKPNGSFFLAQHYVDNPGYDVKLYVIGKDVYAVAKKSPLHPEVAVKEQLLPLAAEWRKLARRVGEIFGLDIYGLDVLATHNGPVVVDINDFPSFGHVPGAVSHVADYILQIAAQARVKRRRNKAMVMQAFTALKPVLQPGQLSNTTAARTRDRRHGERRTTSRSVAVERRQADRRKSKEHLADGHLSDLG
jgi:ribosomal protein S6--L-glutamate ligase